MFTFCREDRLREGQVELGVDVDRLLLVHRPAYTGSTSTRPVATSSAARVTQTVLDSA